MGKKRMGERERGGCFGGVVGEENWGVEGIEIGGYMYSITHATKVRKTHPFLSSRYRTYIEQSQALEFEGGILGGSRLV